jgi:hypothetical protein
MTTVTIQLPDEVSRLLGADPQVIGRQALEALVVDLYRRQKLTHHQLAGALSIDRFEADGVLKRHGVLIEMTAEEFTSELADLRRLAHS